MEREGGTDSAETGKDELVLYLGRQWTYIYILRLLLLPLQDLAAPLLHKLFLIQVDLRVKVKLHTSLAFGYVMFF